MNAAFTEWIIATSRRVRSGAAQIVCTQAAQQGSAEQLPTLLVLEKRATCDFFLYLRQITSEIGHSPAPSASACTTRQRVGMDYCLRHPFAFRTLSVKK